METPTILPVINPVKTLVKAEEIRKIGFKAVITNAYIIKKNLDKFKRLEVHQILGFDGPVMTDSGAYQQLLYGKVDAQPEEMIKFQETLSTDIAVILDVPTGMTKNKVEALKTVEETLERAKKGVDIRDSTKQILWVGPIQGGVNLDLVSYASKELSRLDYHIHALGSPVQLMERYEYDILVDMIVAAKTNMPSSRPLHLFGAGHPSMLALAVALGCDLFDSASYALFARDGRYLTAHWTYRVENLKELPCNCPVCSKTTIEDLKEMPHEELERLLSIHNLYVLAEEIKAIKQSIVEGRLWEHLESRCRAHPKLFKALKTLKKYEKYLERGDPITKGKGRGIFIYDQNSLIRPEVTRHKERVVRYKPLLFKKVVMLPEPSTKPFHKDGIIRKLLKKMVQQDIHVCFYSPTFGVIPMELDETFPLSQFESTCEYQEATEHIAEVFERYLTNILPASPEILIVSVKEDTASAAQRIFNICTRYNARTKIFCCKKYDEVLSRIGESFGTSSSNGGP